jgi:DNA polymerase III epsilon subunit-like protein
MDRKTEFLTNCLILDTETTSKDYNEAEVTELGYVMYNDGNWERFVELYKPNEPITPEVSAITNITNKMVAGCRNFDEGVDDLKMLLGALGQDAAIVAHNSFYDMKVLERYDVSHKTWVCTMRIAKKLYGNDPTVSAFNLPYLRYRFNILDPADHKIDAHRADSDALVTAYLLSHFVDVLIQQEVLEENEPYLQQLQEWLDEPIVFETMPMGKHKGKRLEEVPLDYWQWALANMDSLDETKENFDKDFAASVAIALEKMMS